MKVVRLETLPVGLWDVFKPAEDLAPERMLVVDADDKIVGIMLPASDAEAFLFKRFIAKLNREE